MEEIALKNESGYSPEDVVSLVSVNVSKIIIIEKTKGHFEMIYEEKPLIVEVKAACGFIVKKIIDKLDVIPLGKILKTNDEIDKTNNEKNKFTNFGKMLLYLNERLQMESLHYFENMIISFKSIKEIDIMYFLSMLLHVIQKCSKMVYF